MSAQRTPETEPVLPPRAGTLAAHLREKLRETDGDLYVKSRFLANDLDYSAQEIGAAMRTLCDEDAGPTVEKWAYSSATTWRVTDD